jgi:uncharacterized protein (TIGR03435 family)
LILFALIVHANPLQGLDGELKFDVASVKPVPPGGRGMVVRGGPGTEAPGRISYVNIALKGLLAAAYRVRVIQIFGPAWLDDLKYDIEATIGPGTTRPQFRVMLQNLLKERFHVSLHHENREFLAYQLIVQKRGPQLAVSEETSALDSTGSGAADNSRANLRFINGHALRAFHKAPIGALVTVVEDDLGLPVYDRTGLTGRYDFTMEYIPTVVADSSSAYGSGPNMYSALSLLGLRLVKGKEWLDVLVIDHADKVPTDN